MKLRDKGKYPSAINEMVLTAPDETEPLAAAVEKENSLTSLEQALEQLNSDQQICIKKFYLQKQTYQQISDSTGFSVMQVKSHIQNGKRNLKIHMQRMQPDER